MVPLRSSSPAVIQEVYHGGEKTLHVHFVAARFTPHHGSFLGSCISQVIFFWIQRLVRTNHVPLSCPHGMTRVHGMCDVQMVTLIGAMLILVFMWFSNSMYMNQIVAHMHHESVLAFEHQQLHCQQTDISSSLSEVEQRLLGAHQFVCGVGRVCKSMVHGPILTWTDGSEQELIYPILMHHIDDVPYLSWGLTDAFVQHNNSVCLMCSTSPVVPAWYIRPIDNIWTSHVYIDP